MRDSDESNGLNSGNCNLRLNKTDFKQKDYKDMAKLFINSHILVVSDDHVFCMVLSNMLVGEGSHVSRAFGGENALKLLSENPHKFDLIILDNLCLLPSWFYLLDRLSTIPIIEKIPLILLVNKTETFYIATAIKYAAFDVLYKPVEDHILLNAIGSALQEKKKY